MRIYFYHTQNIQYILSEHEKGHFPGHMLYGATYLEKMGFDIVWHQFIPGASRLKRMLTTSWRILKLGRSIDAVYATHYTGIEPIIFLRALRIFRKPVIIWHHQPVIRPKSKLRDILGRLFYRGIDDMFFFSQKLIDDSLATGKVKAKRLHLGYWGADLSFYDALQEEMPARNGFISSGKEWRDVPTLITAFNRMGAPIDIYLPEECCGFSYKKQLEGMKTAENVKVYLGKKMWIAEFAREVNRHSCVVICCEPKKYTVGLTTLVEAMALGLPVICSRNPQFPVDVDKVGCGISVPYHDVDAWCDAIDFMMSHRKEAAAMGMRGRKLAERVYNDVHCAEIVASVLRKYDRKK